MRRGRYASPRMYALWLGPLRCRSLPLPLPNGAQGRRTHVPSSLETCGGPSRRFLRGVRYLKPWRVLCWRGERCHSKSEIMFCPRLQNCATRHVFGGARCDCRPEVLFTSASLRPNLFPSFLPFSVVGTSFSSFYNSINDYPSRYWYRNRGQSIILSEKARTAGS